MFTHKTFIIKQAGRSLSSYHHSAHPVPFYVFSKLWPLSKLTRLQKHINRQNKKQFSYLSRKSRTQETSMFQLQEDVKSCQMLLKI